MQNIGKNFRERASASWTTSIFRRASERELGNFEFLASERASSPARSQARSRSPLTLVQTRSRHQARSRSPARELIFIKDLISINSFLSGIFATRSSTSSDPLKSGVCRESTFNSKCNFDQIALKFMIFYLKKPTNVI